MTEWEEYKLRELGEVITGKTPSSKFPDEFGDSMPFVTPTDYKNYNKWILYADRNLSQKGIQKLKNKILPENSLLVTCIGSDMGKIAINRIPVITNQQINSIVPNNLVRPDFLYYKLVDCYDIFRTYGTSGTAVPIVNKGDFENIHVEIPKNKNEQTAIAEVLSSLDDKIDLLHRQNKTLEQLAETLFRKWFVEEAVGNEEIILENYVETINGYSYKSSELNPSENALVTLKSFGRDGSFRLDGFKEFTGKINEKQVVKQGDLVVAHTDITQDADIIGNPALVIQDDRYKNLIMTMDCAKVIPKSSKLGIPFLYYLMRTRDFKFHCLGHSNGTTVLHLNKKAIPTFSFLKPDFDKAKLFTLEVDALQRKIFLNHKQTKTLTQLRDSLLPKLMSREVKINLK